MKREDIEKAAKDYSIGKTSFRRNVLKEVDADNYVLRKGNCSEDFIAGAEWRINGVWHDAKDVPQPFRAFVILHDTENDFMMLTQHSITCDSDYNVIYQENDNMIAWAYIEDLIPNTEE